jgi:predicted Zn-dependent protease with MMP-like domain
VADRHIGDTLTRVWLHEVGRHFTWPMSVVEPVHACAAPIPGAQ